MRKFKIGKLMCVLICIAVFSVLLAGCEENKEETDWEPTDHEIVNNAEDITMTIKKGTVSPTGLTVIIKNDSEGEVTYGEPYELEKEINGAWYKVPVLVEDYAFIEIAYVLQPGESNEWKVDWEWLYGSLEEGKYRIIKEVLNYREPGDTDRFYLAAEFTLSE